MTGPLVTVHTAAHALAGELGVPVMVSSVVAADADGFGVAVSYVRTPGMTGADALSCIEAALRMEMQRHEELPCACSACAAQHEAVSACLAILAKLQHGGALHS